MIDLAVSSRVSHGMNAVLPTVRRPWFAAPLPLMVAAGLGAACAVPEGPQRPYTAIAPPRARLPVGDTLRFRATVDGRPCDCLWGSSDGARAAVDETGSVRALAPGVATVTATPRRDATAKASALIELVAP